jgi:hypothetical protein
MSFLDTGRQAIATAAAATGTFERTQIFHGQAEIRLGRELLDHLGQHGGLTFEAINYTTTVRNYVIENVVLDADTLLLIQDGLTIPETSYFAPADKSHNPAVDDDVLIRLPPDEDFIFGFNNVHHGYQHWLTQCIPAIDWSLRQRRDRPVRLVLPTLQPWQEDFLRLLGYGGVPRLTPEPGRQYLFPRVEYSEFLNGATSFRVCLSMHDTAQRILEALPSSPSNHKVIYVRCANPDYGSIAKEAEIVALLQLCGVYIVDENGLDTAPASTCSVMPAW